MDLIEFAGNVALALVLGTLIGIERQWRQHPAGLRTNALVAVGAALFVSLSRLMADTNSPTRIASYIVSGVGFLGGGVILKEGASVRGITTAAALWCSAAVGTLAGAGFGGHAAVGVVAVLTGVVGLRPLARAIDRRQKRYGGQPARYRVRVSCESRDSAVVRTALARHTNGTPGMALTGITARKKKGRKRASLVAEVSADPGDDKGVQDVVNRVMIEPGVTAASWEKLPPAE
ncbi:MgtC/SapB family protein [Gemmata sp.]|uniref:MgtC/SapB family protein n=1 Tax=Gemmata sp. TaxID=1914242 RepID=UPI003F6F479C